MIGAISESAGIGENVFLNPGIGWCGSIRSPDRVQKHDAFVIWKLIRALKEIFIAATAHLFEHSDGECGKPAFHVAIIREAKLDPWSKIFFMIKEGLRG